MIRTVRLLSCFLLAACGGGSEAEFGPPKQLSKEQRPTIWDAAASERLSLPEVGQRRWVGQAPAGWQAGSPAQFRDAQWKIPGQPDVEVYFNAGVGGGVQGNLGRWYGQQFGQATTPSAESLEIVELAGRTGRLAEITGTFQGKPGWAALIAFAWQGDQVASLKMTGPEALVKGQRAAFLALAKSLRQATVSPDPKAPPIEPGQAMPKDHPPVGGAPSGAPSSAASGAPSAAHTTPPAAPAVSPFTATVPAGWAAKAGSNKALHHTFGADGEVYLSQLGGGLKPTLDIWRGELGMQPLTDAEFQALPKVAFLGEDAVLLDLQGNFQSMSGKQIQGARLLVAARLDGNSITFAKLVGAAGDVAAQADAFRSFCGSVRRKS